MGSLFVLLVAVIVALANAQTLCPGSPNSYWSMEAGTCGTNPSFPLHLLVKFSFPSTCSCGVATSTGYSFFAATISLQGSVNGVPAVCKTQAGVVITTGASIDYADLAALQSGIWCSQGTTVNIQPLYKKTDGTLCPSLSRGLALPNAFIYTSFDWSKTANVTCFGNADGKAALSLSLPTGSQVVYVKDGTTDYATVLASTSATGAITTLVAGSYTARVTYSFTFPFTGTCTALGTSTAVVYGPSAPLGVTVTSIQPATCSACANAVVNFTTSGGYGIPSWLFEPQNSGCLFSCSRTVSATTAPGDLVIRLLDGPIATRCQKDFGPYTITWALPTTTAQPTTTPSPTTTTPAPTTTASPTTTPSPTTTTPLPTTTTKATTTPSPTTTTPLPTTTTATTTPSPTTTTALPTTTAATTTAQTTSTQATTASQETTTPVATGDTTAPDSSTTPPATSDTPVETTPGVTSAAPTTGAMSTAPVTNTQTQSTVTSTQAPTTFGTSAGPTLTSCPSFSDATGKSGKLALELKITGCLPAADRKSLLRLLEQIAHLCAFDLFEIAYDGGNCGKRQAPNNTVLLVGSQDANQTASLERAQTAAQTSQATAAYPSVTAGAITSPNHSKGKPLWLWIVIGVGALVLVALVVVLIVVVIRLRATKGTHGKYELMLT